MHDDIPNKLFITDFDGVICDSVWECLLVSYNGYHQLHTPSYQRMLDIEQIEPAKREQFRRLRPYLKGAEDFVPIVLAIEQQTPITSQQDFDAWRTAHYDRLLEYQDAFYTERDFLQQHEKDLWLRLNPLFEGMADLLRRQPSFEGMQILTTKRQQDVLEIFAYQGIAFPAEQITYVKAAGKSQKLIEILQAHNAAFAESVYIEDQVEFLIQSITPGIGSYLVAWGYVSDEQQALARQHGIPIIAPQQFSGLLEQTLQVAGS